MTITVYQLILKGVQFQQMPACVCGGVLTANCDFGHMRGLGRMTYMGVKAGGLAD